MSKFNEIIEEVYSSLSAFHAADQFKPVPKRKEEEESIDPYSPEVTEQTLDILMDLKTKDPEMFNKFVSRLLQIANS